MSRDGADIPLQDKPPISTGSLNNMNTSPSIERRYSSNNIPASESDDNMSHVHTSHADRLLYKFRHRTLCVAVCFAMAISLLACVLSIFAMVKYHDAAKELRTARENREKVCLPCDHQRVQLTAWKQKNEAGDCCVQLQEVLYMMDEIAEEQAIKQIKSAEESRPVFTSANSSLQQSRPSAHLVLIKDTATNAASSIPWQNPSGSKLAHITDGLSIADKGRIKISSAGYYFIYSQNNLGVGNKEAFPASICYLLPDANLPITMIDSLVESNTNTPTTLHQVISEEIIEAPSTTTLMRNANMVWKSLLPRSYSQQTSYVGGVFYLRSDTYVYVSVADGNNRQPLKECRPHECYFGLYKL